MTSPSFLASAKASESQVAHISKALNRDWSKLASAGLFKTALPSIDSATYERAIAPPVIPEFKVPVSDIAGAGFEPATFGL